MTGQILSKIEADLTSAQRGKNEIKISILRFILSKIRDAQILKGKENRLNDEEIEAEIAKEVKNHRESIEAYQKAQRADLVEKEKSELEILQSYLPKQLTEAEILQIVDKVLTEIGTVNSADFGKVIGAVMNKVAGKADGSVVAQIARRRLAHSA